MDLSRPLTITIRELIEFGAEMGAVAFISGVIACYIVVSIHHHHHH